MNYTILVTGPAYGTQNASSAFLFCQALVNIQKHVLHSVFFYCDGVFNANSMIKLATDEFDLVSSWQKLNQKHNVQLYVCNSTALRRGIIEDQHTLDMNLKKGNVARFFKITGLLDLAYSIKICDRIIQF